MLLKKLQKLNLVITFHYLV